MAERGAVQGGTPPPVLWLLAVNAGHGVPPSALRSGRLQARLDHPHRGLDSLGNAVPYQRCAERREWLLKQRLFPCLPRTIKLMRQHEMPLPATTTV